MQLNREHPFSVVAYTSRFIAQSVTIGFGTNSLDESMFLSLQYHIQKTSIQLFFVCILFLMISGKANSENLLIEKMPASRLCELIRNDIDLSSFMKNGVECSTYLKNQINEPANSIRILTEAIYSSDTEIVVAIWQYGGRNRGGDKDLIPLLFERLEGILSALQSPYDKEAKSAGEHTLTQIKQLILAVFRSNTDKKKLAYSLSDRQYFAFGTINLFCDQIVQTSLNGKEYFEQIFDNFGQRVSYKLRVPDEIKHIATLVKIGRLDKACVDTAFKLFFIQQGGE